MNDSTNIWRRAKKPIIAGIVLVGLAITVFSLSSMWGSFGQSGPPLIYYTVTKTDLPIIVSERGYLESQEQTTIRCRVESYDRNSGSSGSTILFIVPNGKVVEKGELLVELDSASLRDRLESETLELQSDKSALLQAEARKENQLTQNETSVAEAKLALELAKLNKKMYEDENSGSFKLQLEEIERQIDDTRNTILEAQAALKLQETEKAGIEQLFKLGYKGKSDLDQSRFAFMKAEAALAAAVNRLTNHDASRRQLQTYQREMELLKLQGDVDTAERNLQQVEVTNKSELEQVNAQLYEAKERVSRQEASIANIERQLEYCKIFAPHAGMVVYAKANRYSRYPTSAIAEGVSVRERQELLTLPDLTKMQIRTQIHEAVLNQVKVGLPVSVRVDAFSNKVYDAVVDEVAIVPSNDSVGNAKTYDCVVRILGAVEDLKPGMTAVSEIHVDRLKDVMAVPVQAVVQVDRESWCYERKGTGVVRRDIELGANNDKFVVVSSGLTVGSDVVLNPMAIVDEQPKKENDISPDAGQPEAPDIPEELLTNAEDNVSEREGPQEGQDGGRRGGQRGERSGGGRGEFRGQDGDTGGQRGGGERSGRGRRTGAGDDTTSQ